MRKGKKRITLDVPDQLYVVIVEMCKKRHMKVTPYIVMAIVELIKKESNWDGTKYI